MKKTMKKWTSFLVAMALVLAMLTTAMAETIYITDGFTLSAGLIGGYRPTPTPTEEPVIGEDADPTPENAETPEGTPQPGEESKDEALDEQNVEGLVVVDREEKTEDENIIEQTEVRTENANIDETVTDSQIVIREAPDGLSNIIMTVSGETPLKITGTEGQWYKVEVDGIAGYVFGADYAGDEENTIDFSGVSVHLFSNRRSGMQDGEPMILTCKVIGYELEYPLQYEWSVDRHDGLGWQRVQGSASTYEFPVSKETLSYDWIVDVYIEIPD